MLQVKSAPPQFALSPALNCHTAVQGRKSLVAIPCNGSTPPTLCHAASHSNALRYLPLASSSQRCLTLPAACFASFPRAKGLGGIYAWTGQFCFSFASSRIMPSSAVRCLVRPLFYLGASFAESWLIPVRLLMPVGQIVPHRLQMSSQSSV